MAREPAPVTILGGSDAVSDAFAASEETLGYLAKVWTDTAGFCATVFAALGDRLGFWRTLAEAGPLSAEALAAATGTQARYVGEWASGMIAAGYLSRDAGGRLVLDPALAPVVAEEAGLVSAGGVHQMLMGLMSAYPKLCTAMRHGGGVDQADYHPDAWAGLERFSATTFDHLLCQSWLPRLPAIWSKLSAGCTLLDVGCGHGRAVRRMAEAFPKSRFHGVDLYAPAIEGARRAAEEAGLHGRVSFAVADAEEARLPAADVVTTFDVLHEADHPQRLAEAVHRSLADGGHWLVMEVNCAPTPEGNAGPLGTMLYGYSLMFCLTTTLARGGEGLGTCGVGHELFATLCRNAGFSRVVTEVPSHPFHRLYLAEK